jgi:hypothetical protein
MTQLGISTTTVSCVALTVGDGSENAVQQFMTSRRAHPYNTVRRKDVL